LIIFEMFTLFGLLPYFYLLLLMLKLL